MPGEGLRIEGVNETSTGSILFKSENSCFKLTLKRSYQQYVVVSTWLPSSSFLIVEPIIFLEAFPDFLIGMRNK